MRKKCHVGKKCAEKMWFVGEWIMRVSRRDGQWNDEQSFLKVGENGVGELCVYMKWEVC